MLSPSVQIVANIDTQSLIISVSVKVNTYSQLCHILNQPIVAKYPSKRHADTPNYLKLHAKHENNFKMCRKLNVNT